jgi:glycosyltransferase involved in cell wall biosynthesis
MLIRLKNKMPSIGIDYTPAYEQGGGIGRLVRDLVAALARLDTQSDYRLFVSGTSLEKLPRPPAPNFQWKPTIINPRWFARIWHRARLPIPVERFIGEVDLFHAMDFVLPPTHKKTKTLLTVHDLSFVRVPDAASPSLKSYLDVVVPRSVSKAQHIIADSQATKDDLIALYAVPEEKITVLLSGVDIRYTPQKSVFSILTIRNKYKLRNSPYIFTVGTIQPRKNYSRVIRALKLLRDAGYDLDLVIAGGKGWLEDEMYKTLDETKLHEHVHLIGFAADEDLPILYSHAEAVVFPSLYEGFGFPVLEGMACGTPVITSNVSSLPEVAGEAAIMVDPYSIEAIADAVRRVLDDSALRESMIERGFAQAAKFTWESSARQLHQIYTNRLAS